MRSRLGLVTVGWCLSILLAAAPAYAGDRGHRPYGYYGGPGHPHGYYRDPPGHRYGHYRERRGHRHRGNEGAYLLGGIVLGAVISQALTPRPSYGYPAYRETYVERVPYREPAVSRRLYRDLDGNCFERRLDGRGRETLLALPDYECAW